MEILYFASILIFILYISVILIKFGVPKSISETAYLFGKNGHIIFYGAFIAFILPLLVYWIEITKEQPQQALVFLSCAALCFTGISGQFKGDKGKMLKNIHSYSVFIAIILSQLWMWTSIPNSWWWTSAVLFPMLGFGYLVPGTYKEFYQDTKSYSRFINKEKHSYIFWVEIGLFALAYFSIFIFSKL